MPGIRIFTRGMTTAHAWQAVTQHIHCICKQLTRTSQMVTSLIAPRWSSLCDNPGTGIHKRICKQKYNHWDIKRTKVVEVNSNYLRFIYYIGRGGHAVG
jgi:hypothetical protein